MNRHIKRLLPLKPLCTILGAVFICISCASSKNVCTLAPEQFPEVKGFRLGMSYEQIKQRFPSICTLEEPISRQLIIQIEVSKQSVNDKIDNLTKCSSMFSTSVSMVKYPELDGILVVSLTLNKDGLRQIHFGYDVTRDEQFKKEFVDKTIKSLGLPEKNNWTNTSKLSFEAPIQGITIDGKELTCNNLKFYIGTKHFEAGIKSFDSPYLVIENQQNQK